MAATRTPDGTWGVPVVLGDGDSYGLTIGSGGSGRATASWASLVDGHWVTLAATRADDGSWSAAQTLSGGDHALKPSVAVDPDGDALVAWNEGNVIGASADDAAPPHLRDLTVPATATAGASITLSVRPVDLWSALDTTTWDFGDGQSGTGDSVTHVYTTAGVRTVTVTAADVTGQTITATATITVSAPAAPPPAPDSGPVSVPAPPAPAPAPPTPAPAPPTPAPAPPTPAPAPRPPALDDGPAAAPALSVAVDAVPEVGSELAVDPGRWINASTHRVQFQRCAGDDDTECQDIEGTAYTPGPADNGFRLRARVTAVNAQGVETVAYTALSGAVRAARAAAPSPAEPAAVPPSPTVSAPCVSQRTVRLHWRLPRRTRASRITVTVDGSVVARLEGTARAYSVNLNGRPVGRANVVVSASTRRGSLSLVRAYRLCGAPGRSSPTSSLILKRRP